MMRSHSDSTHNNSTQRTALRAAADAGRWGERMNTMRTIVACILLIVSAAIAADTVDQIIADTGLLVYSDGSSFFAFKRGGRFESGPMGMSGRTIDGAWTRDQDGRYVVKGRWGWINGLSVTNDYRTMTLWLSHPHDPSTNGMLFSMTVTNRPVTIYKVYALVDSLTKDEDTKPQQEARPHGSPAAGSPSGQP